VSADTCPCCGQTLPSAYDVAAEAARLSHKQRALFNILAARNGRTVRHDFIHEVLWGDDPNGGPNDARNVLAVMVNHANSRLSAVGYRIRNVWGVGYRLEAISADEVAA
jgi:DNA-binding response OmpR family regulator